MIEEDLWKTRRKKQTEYHSWRKRKSCYGEMLQFEGSYHDWFEGRNGICEWCLLATIDDVITNQNILLSPHQKQTFIKH
ncbi:MAG: hypothetical protein A3G45_01560 [Candidatus Staskawiczbacteria bacterium RIFCSPLOWO2_12_FULL_37_15]|uniref:Uncharacterized protein n=1 Tax=Candidatus Staskawiczbacteria bacterium RIFCSPLOWO2_12_FULL_37_15 TaxID=1802218 RepID=A0A1G2IKR6_9BACT|nr:MAG: hypothetical protein A3G45_01560 [Candidatus Staskawiczbacteria bacterium RIFCSPLOWO2_12_FULL_37_15]